MAAKQHERSLERKNALQVLYQGEMVDEKPEDLIAAGLLIDETKLLGDYAQDLLRGTQEHLDELDAYIDAASENWALDRMPIVDRSYCV